MKKFIIKADDFLKDGLTERWRHFLQSLNSLNIKASLGLVGRGLKHYACPLTELSELTRIHELFAHGYEHFVGRSGKCEYYGTDLSRQVASIRNTLLIAKEVLGREIVTFGAPGNRVDNVTVEALQKVDEVKIIFFQPNVNGRITLIRNLELEYRHAFDWKYVSTLWYYANIGFAKYGFRSFDNCGYEELVVRFHKANGDLIIGQLHPQWWTVGQQKGLFRFFDYLQRNGLAEFILPGQLLDS